MYNIMRTGKVKDRKKISDAASHNFRIRLQGNIDKEKIKDNVIFVNDLEADIKDESSLQKKLTEYYKGLGVKERNNSVLMQEFVVSASPEFFINLDDEKVKLWANHQVEFFKKEFGNNLKVAVLHLDEATPHLHFMLSTEEKSVKRYKNQKGEFFKEGYSLNAKRWGPEFLKGLHTRQAEHNKILGLKRGENGSKRVHKTLKEYYSEINELEIELKSKLDRNKKNEEIIEKAKFMITKAKEIMDEQYNCIVDLLNILSGKDLEENEVEKVNQISERIRRKNNNKNKIN